MWYFFLAFILERKLFVIPTWNYRNLCTQIPLAVQWCGVQGGGASRRRCIATWMHFHGHNGLTCFLNQHYYFSAPAFSKDFSFSAYCMIIKLFRSNTQSWIYKLDILFFFLNKHIDLICLKLLIYSEEDTKFETIFCFLY